MYDMALTKSIDILQLYGRSDVKLDKVRKNQTNPFCGTTTTNWKKDQKY